MSKPKKKCHFCKEEIEDNDVVIEAVGKSRRSFHKAKNCYCAYMNSKKDKEAQESESKAEYVEWDKLYQYVRKEILGYSEGMKLTPYQRNRLLALRNGTYVKRNTALQKKGYSYKVILDTFKIKKQNIIASTMGKTFENEKHKFSYIMVIVEDSINDVHKRHMQSKKEKQVISSVSHLAIDLNKSREEYKRKNVRTKSKVASLLKDLL